MDSVPLRIDYQNRRTKWTFEFSSQKITIIGFFYTILAKVRIAAKIEYFLKNSKTRNKRYNKKKFSKQVTLQLPSGEKIKLSPGVHNELQARIISSFRENFADAAEVLYIGDTSDKYLHIKVEKLNEIGIDISKKLHTKLPDVILFDAEKKWLYLIEAVSS